MARTSAGETSSAARKLNEGASAQPSKEKELTITWRQRWVSTGDSASDFAFSANTFSQIGLSGAWKWFRKQGQLLHDLFRRQDLHAILTESSGCLLQIRLRIRECLSGRFQSLGRRTYFAEGFFDPNGCVQNEHAKPEGTDNKRMRLELGKEDTIALTHVEGLFSYIHVELSFKHVEEFVLT